jgi:hypothetical protein
MNDDDVETAQPGGRSTDFPKIWGRPAGSQWSEERAAWVRDRVARFAGLQALDELARRDNRYLHTLRVALLMSRRRAP